ncbi:hypothetical protein EUX98_g2228 [Antrodiella citrinella]|uniref:Uncharacterized protein n=1 Tax=Antrodiella citrinella TaxID=2447956 RepID=A0A4S4N7S4_9APHY|nr:hypothetical protein EUX98_g2228 [Antrodiella citrinella]
MSTIAYDHDSEHLEEYKQLGFSPTDLYNIVLRKSMSKPEIRAAGLEPEVDSRSPASAEFGQGPVPTQHHIVRVLALACKAARDDTYAMTLLPVTGFDSTADQILYVAGDQAVDTSNVCEFLETLLQAMRRMAETRRGTTEYQDAWTTVIRIVLKRATGYLRSLPPPQKLHVFLKNCTNSDPAPFVYSEFTGLAKAITDLKEDLQSTDSVDFSRILSSLRRLRAALPSIEYWERAKAEFGIDKADLVDIYKWCLEHYQTALSLETLHASCKPEFLSWLSTEYLVEYVLPAPGKTVALLSTQSSSEFWLEALSPLVLSAMGEDLPKSKPRFSQLLQEELKDVEAAYAQLGAEEAAEAFPVHAECSLILHIHEILQSHHKSSIDDSDDEPRTTIHIATSSPSCLGCALFAKAYNVLHPDYMKLHIHDRTSNRRDLATWNMPLIPRDMKSEFEHQLVYDFVGALYLRVSAKVFPDKPKTFAYPDW